MVKTILTMTLLTGLMFQSYSQNNCDKIDIEYSILKSTKYLCDQQEVSRKDFEQIVRTNATAFSSYSKGKIQETLGTVMLLPSVILFSITLENSNDGNTPYAWQWAGSVGGSLIGLVLFIRGRKNITNAIELYNSNNNVSLNFKSEGMNLGLTLNF